jgi:hypothetical protein
MKGKLLRTALLLGSATILFQGGCSLDSWWVWAAGAGVAALALGIIG